MDRIIECVPNYSEGRNKEIIDQIVAAVLIPRSLPSAAKNP